MSCANNNHYDVPEHVFIDYVVVMELNEELTN